MSHLPKVTIIIPTTHDRVSENENILNMACRQDYINKEILWDYGDESIGIKRNKLCERASGEAICHMDSDDFYSDDWISKSVNTLIEKKADIVGLRDLFFYDEVNRQGYRYTYPATALPFVAGATMVYWRHFWYNHMFQDSSMAEDVAFAFKTRNIWAHDNIEGFVASIHAGNTCIRPVHRDKLYVRCSEEENEGIRRRFFGSRGNDLRL